MVDAYRWPCSTRCIACAGCVAVLGLLALVLKTFHRQEGITWQATTLASNYFRNNAIDAQNHQLPFNDTRKCTKQQAPRPIALGSGTWSPPDLGPGDKQNAPPVETLPNQTASSAETWRGVKRRAPGRLKNVALCFYGLTRSLSRTIRSIRVHLIQPLEQAGYNVDIFLHTYNLKYLQNEWSHENTALNTSEWHLLDPLEAELTSQEEFLTARREDIRQCEQQGSPWPGLESWNETLRNHLLQLNSLQRVAAIWQRRHATDKYHAVIYARPDVLFACPLPVNLLTEMQEQTLYVPDHDSFGGYNDRFSMGRPSTAAIYGRRYQYTVDRCNGPIRPQNRAHAETNVKRLVSDEHLSVYEVPRFYFFRVRANGVAVASDLKQKPACKPELLNDVLIDYWAAEAVLEQQKHLREELLW